MHKVRRFTVQSDLGKTLSSYMSIRLENLNCVCIWRLYWVNPIVIYCIGGIVLLYGAGDAAAKIKDKYFFEEQDTIIFNAKIYKNTPIYRIHAFLSMYFSMTIHIFPKTRCIH